MDDYAKNIKKNTLALMREHKPKVTQKELAKIVNMSQPSISKALSTDNEYCFDLDQLIKIADYFNVSLDELVGRQTLPSAKSNSGTMADIISLLFDLEETTNINVDSFSETEIEPHPATGDPYPVTTTTHYISFNSRYLNEFMEKWKSARLIADSSDEICKEMYSAWKKTILESASKYALDGSPICEYSNLPF